MERLGLGLGREKVDPFVKTSKRKNKSSRGVKEMVAGQCTFCYPWSMTSVRTYLQLRLIPFRVIIRMLHQRRNSRSHPGVRENLTLLNLVSTWLDYHRYILSINGNNRLQTNKPAAHDRKRRLTCAAPTPQVALKMLYISPIPLASKIQTHKQKWIHQKVGVQFTFILFF